ncbi:hypothetical protein HY450_01770 [Candidatus Pacearchaeota archaeon]|nr:hypothetical protein [Candidatus Pacearchaeota archaeon]
MTQDLRDKFEAAAEKWERYCEEQVSSYMDTYVFNPPADELVKLGKPILPLMEKRYENKKMPGGCVVGFSGLVGRIAGAEFESTFPADISGKIDKMFGHTIKWIRDNYK